VGTDKGSEGGARPEDVEHLAEKYTPAWESDASVNDATWEEPSTAAPVHRQGPPPPAAAPRGPIEPFAPAPADDPIPLRAPVRPAANAAGAAANPPKPPAQPPGAPAADQPPPAQPPQQVSAVATPERLARPRQARTIVGLAPPEVAQVGAAGTPAGPVPALVDTAPMTATTSAQSGVLAPTSPAPAAPAEHEPPNAPTVPASSRGTERSAAAVKASSAGDYAMSVPPTPLQPPVQPAAAQLPTVMIADAAFPAHEKAAAAKVDTYDEITVAAPRRGRKRKLVLMAGGAVAAVCLVALVFSRTASDRQRTSPQDVVSSPTSISHRASSTATAASALSAPAIPAPPADQPPVAAPVASTPSEERQPPVQPTATDLAAALEKSQEPASRASRPAQSNARKTTTHKAPQPAKAGAIVRDVPF
jgi:hypothetical protein